MIYLLSINNISSITSNVIVFYHPSPKSQFVKSNKISLNTGKYLREFQ